MRCPSAAASSQHEVEGQQQRKRLLLLCLFIVSISQQQASSINGGNVFVLNSSSSVSILAVAANIVAAHSSQIYELDRHLLTLQAARGRLSRKRRRQLLKLLWQLLRQQRRATRIWALPRQKVWWFDFAQYYTGDRWVQTFRLEKNVFAFLCDQFFPDVVKQDTNFRAAIPVPQRVASVIYFLAHAASFPQVSELFGIGASTVCEEVYQVCNAIVNRLADVYIR
jgi:hypothetical protein